jgi:PIN domain nuclease of toxin-antitoxin system
MAIKASLGRLEVPANLLEILDHQGFVTLSIEPRHAWAVADLPLGEHKDPFDRQLAAQALLEDLPIISADEQLDHYGVTRAW